MEEEVRHILRDAVRHAERPAQPLGTRMSMRFRGHGLRDDLPELRNQSNRPATISLFEARLGLAAMRDTQIAGIAVARRGTLAARNVRHFTDLDVPVVDPWSG